MAIVHFVNYKRGTQSRAAMRVLNLISFFIINDLSEMISLVPSESWGFLKGGLVPPLKLRRRRRVKAFPQKRSQL